MKIQTLLPSKLLAACLLAGLLPACASSIHLGSGGHADSPAAPNDKAAQAQEEKAHATGEKLRELRHQVQKAERALHHARVEQELKKLARWLSRDQGQFEMESAEVALMQATEKHARFNEFERGLQEEEARISLDRSADRLIGVQQDLQGILDIYEQEEEARSRDEIIRRHRMSVTFAERGKDLAATRLRVLLERELPAKALVLERVKVQAARKLELLNKAKGSKELEQNQIMSRTQEAIGEAEYALESARRKLNRAQHKAQREEDDGSRDLAGTSDMDAESGEDQGQGEEQNSHEDHGADSDQAESDEHDSRTPRGSQQGTDS